MQGQRQEKGVGVCKATGELPDSRREAPPTRHPAPPARPAAAPAQGARLSPRPAPRAGQPPPRQQRSGRYFRARSGSAHKRNPPTLSDTLGGQDLLQLGGLRREAHARLDRGLHARVAPEPRGARARARGPRLGGPRLPTVRLIEVKQPLFVRALVIRRPFFAAKPVATPFGLQPRGGRERVQPSARGGVRRDADLAGDSVAFITTFRAASGTRRRSLPGRAGGGAAPRPCPSRVGLCMPESLS